MSLCLLHIDMVQMTQYNNSIPQHQRQQSTVHRDGLSILSQLHATVGRSNYQHYSNVFKHALVMPTVFLWTGAGGAAMSMRGLVHVYHMMKPHSMKS